MWCQNKTKVGLKGRIHFCYCGKRPRQNKTKVGLKVGHVGGPGYSL